jgi:hypothetical protein
MTVQGSFAGIFRSARSTMGSGGLTHSSLRAVALWLLVLGAVGSLRVDDGTASTSPEQSNPLSFESLLADFASMPGMSAHFHEEKHLALLREPLVSRGELYFTPPDRLLRRVLEPIESTLLVERGQLSVESARGRKSIDLDTHPMLRFLVDSFRNLLAGDHEALRARYDIDFEPGPEPGSHSWRIRLEPLRPPLKDVIRSIRIEGRGRVLAEMRLIEVRGDETVTRFSDVDASRRFTATELAELFRSPAP